MNKSVSLFGKNWDIVHVLPHMGEGSFVVLRAQEPIQMCFHSTDRNATWGTSEIREYLNTGYFNELASNGNIEVIQGVHLCNRISNMPSEEWRALGFPSMHEGTKDFVFIETFENLLYWSHIYDGDNPPRMFRDLAIYSLPEDGLIINNDTLEQGKEFIYCMSNTGELSSIEKDEVADVYPCILVEAEYLPEDICPIGRKGHTTCEGCCFCGEFRYSENTEYPALNECIPK